MDFDFKILNQNKIIQNQSQIIKIIIIILEGTKPIIMIMEGTPPLRGEPYPTL